MILPVVSVSRKARPWYRYVSFVWSRPIRSRIVAWRSWTCTGSSEVTAIGAALVAGLIAGVVFVEVVPLALAVDLRLLRSSVFARALALGAVAGPLARALLRGTVTEAIAAAVATFALLSGEPLPALLGVAVLALAPALWPREAFLWSLAGIALAILRDGSRSTPSPAPEFRPPPRASERGARVEEGSRPCWSQRSALDSGPAR
jgi:hypothetical protein